ncbi:MAG: SET domain-containing protein-lysine N-methyltransferase [Ignavibacteriaceae bacterium]|jgi:SET domain-containing protein|nr:SET domain-containing protein-lysine N-methyltransferase [Ignavibacteriaceae bacterium]
MYKNFLKVDKSSVHGNGLFANASFKEGDIIIQITGEVIDSDECERRENEENNVYIFYKNDNELIDVSDNLLLKYINHSCNYNCDVDEDENGNLTLYAASSIDTGDELTIHYGYEDIYEYCACVNCENKKSSI